MKKKYVLILIISVLSLILISTNVVSSFNKTKPFENTIDKPKFINWLSSDTFLKINYPLSSTPLITEKQKDFSIRFESREFDNVWIHIETAYEPVVDEIWLEIDDLNKNNGIWEVITSIPEEVPEELYNITIVVENHGRYFYSTQPRAISVVDEISDSFSFVHITDFHVGDPRGFTESITETIGWKSIKKCIEEINLLHPDFVVISGDLTFGQLYPFEYSREYKKCFEMLQLFDVPTYLCPGNHDGYRRILEDGLKMWNKYFGPHYYSFDYGDFHFQAINSYDMPAISRFTLFFITLNWGGSISDSQINWIEEDLISTDSENVFMFMHHNPLWETTSDSLVRKPYQNRAKLLSLIDEHDVDMVLAGHVHFDNVTIENETIFLTTTTPESEIRVEDGYWGYRLIDIENGEIENYNYKEPKYSIPSYHLNHSFIDPFTANIQNDLEMDVNVLLRFKVPKNNYDVTNGVILQQRENHFMKEIYVISLVEKQSELRVTLTEIA